MVSSLRYKRPSGRERFAAGLAIGSARRLSESQLRISESDFMPADSIKLPIERSGDIGGRRFGATLGQPILADRAMTLHCFR
jgi:hypothetical protein